jgi:hypothetical protein
MKNIITIASAAIALLVPEIANCTRVSITIGEADYREIDGVGSASFGKAASGFVPVRRAFCKNGRVTTVSSVFKKINPYKGQIKSILIPSNVKVIQDKCFQGFCNLGNVEFENESQLGKIGGYAFENCSRLCSIYIPAGLPTLSTAIFCPCLNLVSVTFSPKSRLESFENWAFRYALLSCIRIPATVKRIGMGCFYECNSLGFIELEAGSKLGSIGFGIPEGVILKRR